MTMSRTLKKNRQQTAWLALVFIVLLSLTLVAQSMKSNSRPETEFNARPVFEELRTTPQSISIITADQSYELALQNSVWVIPTKAGFPVSQDRISNLLNAIETAKVTGPRTARADRHDLLGLADPDFGGSGAKITIGLDEPIAAIIGTRNEKTYMRHPNEDQTYVLDKAFPPLHSAEWWLDLESIGLPITGQVEQVIIDGRVINPATTPLNDTDSILWEAHQTLSLQDVDVGPDAIAPVTRQDVQFHDGTNLIIDVYVIEGRIWAGFSGSALAVPDLTNGRIFKLDPIMGSDFLPSD